jgi:predicted transcriptional regulator of viral defense system
MLQNNTNETKILKTLLANNYRIFEVSEVYDLMKGYFTPSQLREILHILKKKSWIRSIKRGVYCLADYLLPSPLHEYEIISYLIKDPIFSYYSAFDYHKLTDQIPRTIYIAVLTNVDLPRIKQLDSELDVKFVKNKSDKIFGIKEDWFGETLLKVTDLEKTLLDGLSRPKYCGGFSEVYRAFKISKENINLNKIVEYALKLDITTIKRLGWVLDTLEIEEDILLPLEKEKISWLVNLNPDGLRKGSINRKWQIIENAGFH